ncbi:MAG: iron-containing alcohol dehydrogenase [Spirochaetaceae bacterium]|nr:MAG: iron-containing alcohol dehydrogenase [Spirochaetaceae bacterium]
MSRPHRLYARFRRSVRRIGRRTAPDLIDTSAAGAARFVRSLRGAGYCPFLLADDHTAAACPEVVDELSAPGSSWILPGTPRVVPAIETSRELSRRIEAAGTTPMLVVVGAGTLTDIAKHAALSADVPVIALPTAPSVDAYASARSALRIDGYHRTPSCRVPAAVLSCADVIEAAPDELILAGLGDLTAKLIARIDWEVSSIVTGEPFDRAQADWCAFCARSAVASLRHGTLRSAAIPALDALMVSGLSMQLIGASRPAASAEHTLAHLWEIAVPFDPSQTDLHGLLVTTAIRTVVERYRSICAALSTGKAPSGSAHDIAAAEAGWRDRVPVEMSPFTGKMEEESAGRSLGETEVTRRRDAIAVNRGRIVELCGALDDAERALDALDRAGIGAYEAQIPDVWVTRAIDWVRYLRNRYSLFDVEFEMGWTV